MPYRAAQVACHRPRVVNKFAWRAEAAFARAGGSVLAHSAADAVSITSTTCPHQGKVKEEWLNGMKWPSEEKSWEPA